jgi:hypothetical protein
MAREGESFFDDLARGLANGSISRGKALRLMGAALVGGTLGSLGGVAAADDLCKPTGKKCRKDTQCCSGNCSKSGTSRFGTCAAACTSNGGTCSSNTDCCSGNCPSGTCCGSNGVSCSTSGECCSGNCVSGTCSACPSGMVPAGNGTCIRPCDPNTPGVCGARCSCSQGADNNFYCSSGSSPAICQRGLGSCPAGYFCGGTVCVVAC